LTIGIDARAASEVQAGRGRVVRELLRALAERSDDRQRYVLYARTRWDETTLDERFRWALVGAADPWWHLLTARRANRECDVFLSSNSYLTVWFLRIPAVPVVYDMTTFEPSMRPNRRSTLIERATLGVAVRRAAGIVAISQATADALAARYPRAAALTRVAPLAVPAALGEAPQPSAAPTTRPAPIASAVPLGASAGPVQTPASAPSSAAAPVAGDDALPPPGFVLAVGTLEPRKNLPRLVEAYTQLPAPVQREHPLVVVGALGWETGPTLSAIDSLGDRAVRLGHVSDRQLAELYRRCALFCYPSLGEGFGLPVLEAMAAGAAVITSNLSSLPEVGGDAVEYVDPFDTADLARALERLLGSPERRAELGRLARQRAAAFSWQRTAESTLAVLEDAAAHG
jgi:alpha-1,3-rhamnosyl/mannosyltransferase